ncbi:S-receptor-like serine/threonine-protein kinase protein [Dioscorea alata]|uniref:S-receptor-like serine/threonine-protein kinase protein n=1 Tax=Dioscorea alata TaxID=55571 RepID=A0ACB7WAA2_DIOAL|nr:S-receptor-like serine/threonine-protein kinase protein [Dioscorea alata]
MMLSSSYLPPLLVQLVLLSQIILVILIHFPEQTRAQSYKNISLGTTLTTSGTTTSWLSPSGDFAFGFIPTPSNTTTTTTSLFLLAIWFAKTADKAIVWTANGDNPAPAESKLYLSSNGQLLLTGPAGDTIFSSTSGGSHAALLDTGNLVLVDASSGSTIWQSFENPTDTILPTQVLSANARLRSRLAATNYSKGRFTLFQDSGNFILSQVAIPTGDLYKAYWSSDKAADGAQLFFNGTTGNINFYFANKTLGNIISANLSSSSLSEFYQRSTLDIDGVFRYYIYPKNSSTGWKEKWSIRNFVPTDGCMRMVTDDCCGSGVCGYNSFCQMDAEDELTTCKCPDGYSPIDSGDEYKGCSPDFAPQRCDIDDSARFQLTAMRSVDWPRIDYEHYSDVSEEQCREYCLQDCFCAVAIFRDQGCWKKRLPLANGRSTGVGQGTMAFIKVPKDGAISRDNQPAEQKDNLKRGCSKALIVAGSSLLGGSVLMNVLLLAYTLIIAFYFSVKRKEKQAQTYLDAVGFNHQSFSHKQLLEATNNFSEELGRGSFGIVYKGVLRRETANINVAVKKLDRLSKDAEKEFMAEVRSIGQTHHKNLVRLIGFCNEGENRLLVYEFMSNGSLASFLFGETKPEWNKRVKIILGVARALFYLHEECTSPIIHCDIKSQNILLDDNFVARISDFGLAKLLRADQTRTSTGIRGTKGYVAPEWFKNMPVTTKVDVYSFGVLLLEIICCRKNFKQELASDHEEKEVILVYWAYDCYRNGRLDLLLVASDREAMIDRRRLERFVMIAIWCIQEDPSLRPSMQKVTLMLEGSVAVPVPPDPSSFMSSIQ